MIGERPEFKDEDLEKILDLVKFKVDRRLEEKGRERYAGPHETYGILAEEFDELMEAMRDNNAMNFYLEVLDIAVAAVLGMASFGLEKEGP